MFVSAFASVICDSLQCLNELCHCCWVTPYGEIYLGQRWLGYWLVAWRHLAITWTNFDLYSEKSSDNHPMEISQEISQSSISKMNTKIYFLITYLNFLSNLPVTSGQWVNLGSIVAQPCITREWANLPPAVSWVGQNPIVNSLAWVSLTECWCLLETYQFVIDNHLSQHSCVLDSLAPRRFLWNF